MNILRTGVATVLLSSSIAGQAATFDFDRASGNIFGIDAFNSYTQTEDGITVSVTANGKKVSQTYSQGLGVGSYWFDYLIKSGESLTFSFDQAVDIDHIVLNGFGLGTVSWDGGSISNLDGSINVFPGINGKPHMIGLTNITSFTFTSDRFFLMVDGLKGVTATTAVPVPAAAWLFGTALIALASIGRNRG